MNKACVSKFPKPIKNKVVLLLLSIDYIWALYIQILFQKNTQSQVCEPNYGMSHQHMLGILLPFYMVFKCPAGAMYKNSNEYHKWVIYAREAFPSCWHKKVP